MTKAPTLRPTPRPTPRPMWRPMAPDLRARRRTDDLAIPGRRPRRACHHGRPADAAALPDVAADARTLLPPPACATAQAAGRPRDISPAPGLAALAALGLRAGAAGDARAESCSDPRPVAVTIAGMVLARPSRCSRAPSPLPRPPPRRVRPARVRRELARGWLWASARPTATSTSLTRFRGACATRRRGAGYDVPASTPSFDQEFAMVGCATMSPECLPLIAAGRPRAEVPLRHAKAVQRAATRR